MFRFSSAAEVLVGRFCVYPVLCFVFSDALELFTSFSNVVLVSSEQPNYSVGLSVAASVFISCCESSSILRAVFARVSFVCKPSNFSPAAFACVSLAFGPPSLSHALSASCLVSREPRSVVKTSFPCVSLAFEPPSLLASCFCVHVVVGVSPMCFQIVFGSFLCLFYFRRAFFDVFVRLCHFL